MNWTKHKPHYLHSIAECHLLDCAPVLTDVSACLLLLTLILANIVLILCTVHYLLLNKYCTVLTATQYILMMLLLSFLVCIEYYTVYLLYCSVLCIYCIVTALFWQSNMMLYSLCCVAPWPWNKKDIFFHWINEITVAIYLTWLQLVLHSLAPSTSTNIVTYIFLN